MADKDTKVEKVDRKDDDVTVEGDGPRQRVRRMPEDTEIGPFFPSGMSAPEALHAGATAAVADREKAAEQKASDDV